MSFLETVEQARGVLERNGRVSLRGLKREFGLDEDALDELVEELVDVQQVAAREGNVLSWISNASSVMPAAPTQAPALPAAAALPSPSPPAEPTLSPAPAPATAAATPPRTEVAAAPTVDGERRQLTVLFCDLVDSVKMAAGLDPEDWREVVDAYQKAAGEEIQRLAGHVAQYLGDGLLVYFGYPQAHEDAAIRGVSAALAILDELPQLNARIQARLPALGHEGLRVRIGIHTGPVVMGKMGSGPQAERLALGDTVNMASRLLGVCEPDCVVISEATRRLVRGIFVFEDLGQKILKGIDDPVPVHQVLRRTGVGSRLDVSAAAGLTPLVGREQEVALLLDRWELVTEGHGQVVLLSGEPGMGKSRLVQVLREELAEYPQSWLEIRCSPYHENNPLYPIIGLFEQVLLLSREDSADDRVAKLEAALGRAGFSLPKIFPLFANLLSIPLPERYPPLTLSPDAQRRMTLETLTTWLFAVAKQQPMILVAEDLQWIDPSSLELLGMLVEQAPTVPLLLLATFRPDFVSPWASHSHMVHLTLNPLSRRQVRRMLEGITGGQALPTEVVEEVVAKTDGVPLFVEELTKMVLESDLLQVRDGEYVLSGPLPPLAIPTTLQDSLMARLDRLGSTKEVVQLGAVLGREFSHEMLESVSSSDRSTLAEALVRLVHAELLYRRGTPPDATYTFKHSMIQDAAYQSLLRSARQQFHARIAQVLEDLFPEDVESAPEMIARHYDEAGLAEPAIAHYQRAGERSAERSANQESIVQLRRALELLATLPEAPERNQRELRLRMSVGMALSAARGWGDPECEAAFERARSLASHLGDGPDLPRALVALATSYYAKGEIARSAEVAKQALTLAERAGAIYLLSAHYAVGSAALFQGEFLKALHHLEQTIELYDPAEHAAFAHTFGSDRGVVSRSYAAWCHWFLGRPDQALASTLEAVALARRVEHPFSLATALAFASVFHFLRGERDMTREYAEETIALCERLGFPLYLGVGRALRGWAQADAGEQGVAEIQQALAELARTSTGAGAPVFLAMLAEATWRIGRYDHALGALGLGVARAEETGQHFWDAELHRLHAQILLDKGDGAEEEAEALFRRSLEIAQSQEARSLELRTAMSYARLLAKRGQRDEARKLLAPVYDGFAEGLGTPDLKAAKELLALAELA
jgi:class 3 adenylate cyclase/predicted ATPase